MRIRYYFFMTVMCCAVFLGRAAQAQDVDSAEQHTSGGLAIVASSQGAGDTQAAAIPAQTAGVLTLQQAHADGLMHSPELASFSWDMRAAEARELQAGFLPNPELSVELENFAGNNEANGFRSAETTVAISQLFELGGKRGYRKRTAELEKNLAGWEYEIKRLDVFQEISSAFWEVLASQERVVIADALFDLAQQAHSSAAKKVAAGKAPPVEEVQATIALTTSELECRKTKSDFKSSRNRLASAIGKSAPEFEKAEGAFMALAAVPSLETLSAMLDDSPDMRRWKTELEKRKVEIKLTDAGAISDITISAGARYFNDNDDKVMVAGFSVPLPLFSRNQGERQEARCNAAKGAEEHKSAIIKIQNDLAQSYYSCASAFALAAALRDKAIPAAQQAFEVTRKGYWQGKFSYLMVLDAQRTLFELQQQYVDTLEDYHVNRVAIERLTGQSIQ
jgi:cobalt-zinc-cadmium efflux system outer membrane protein